MNIAYISQGKLFLKSPDSSSELIESDFGKQIMDTTAKINKKNEWKNNGRGAQFMGGAGPWGGTTAEDPENLRIHICAISRGSATGEITYALDTDDIGGLFRYNNEKKNEHRLFHRQNINISHIDQHPKEELLLCSLSNQNGGMDLQYMKGIGRLNQLTEGDSVDMAPSWVPNEDDTLVYQSAGVGRSSEGYIMGYGPFSIQKISLAGKVETLIENDNFDYLLPHEDSKGNLYYIKRPYEHPNSNKSSSSNLDLLKDILYFPFRLMGVFFAFLNFMSMMLTGKSLTTAVGPQRDSKKDKMIWLMGRMIDTDKALKANKRKGNQSIVPSNWELMCRSANGEEKQIAKGVVSFDLDQNDKVVYTDGKKVYKLDGSEREILFEDKIIEHVAIV